MEVKKLSRSQYSPLARDIKLKALEVPVIIAPATNRERSWRMAIEKWTEAAKNPNVHTPSGSYGKRDSSRGRYGEVSVSESSAKETRKEK